MARLDRLSKQPFVSSISSGERFQGELPSLSRWAYHYYGRLLKETDLEQLLSLPAQRLRVGIEKALGQMIEEEKQPIPYEDRVAIIDLIINEAMGFGPLQPLLEDPTITEIMVNAPDEVYVERNGQLSLAPVHLKDNQHIEHIIDRIVAPLGRRIDKSSPMVDARLPDGSRVNAIIPPLSVDGPVLTIRLFKKEPFKSTDLVVNETLTEEMKNFLDLCVKAKINIIVSGGTGAGKTTTLNVLSTFLPAYERIIVIEDSAELRFHERKLDSGRRPHVVRLEARPPNIEGKGEISIQQLVRNSLRMRPNRIVVGEVRGGEALDMLQAMNTGHEGSLTTIHANSPQDALSRLEMLVSMAGRDLPVSVVRQHIETIEIILQQDRMPDGTRRITSISEFRGYGSDDRPILNDIYRFEVVEAARYDEQTSNSHTIGYFQAVGFEPVCKQQLLLSLQGKRGREKAIALWEDWLRPDRQAWVNQKYLTEEERSEFDV